MPIYEYQCESCGKITDLKHAFREEPPTKTCPSCGASPLKRKFNAAGIIFKGSGYYINDSRSSKESLSKSDPAPAATTPAAPSTSTAAPSTPTPPKSDAAA